MKIPLLTIIKENPLRSEVSMELFYSQYNISRQGFTQALAFQAQQDEMMLEIKERVRLYRLKNDRRAGSRTLFHNLDIKRRYDLGVTKFERLMSAYGLSLAPLRLRVVTTKSSSQSWNYKNLCNGLIITGINQLVVGDITYVVLGKKRYYLFSLTDVFSLRIVGYHMSERMRKEEAISALEMFIDLRGDENLINCIHHTDGGGQYFAKKYLNVLGEMKSSVAGTCLENGLAEQKNGYIKNHLIPTVSLNNPDKIAQEIDRVMHFYNHERKQSGLGWKSPVEFENELKSNKKKLYVRLHDFEKNIPSKAKRF
jgi:transposase InsO family protein